ncbi:Uncharacterised protein [uncultured archaeon]|nr:Uncharacterised protein [uncultured archaeon]
MVYKKYIKRNGKFYGPYIYNSRRVNGKVISEYHGAGKKDYRRFAFFILGILVLAVSVFVILNSNGKISGNVVADNQISSQPENALTNESGTIIYPSVYFTLILKSAAAPEKTPAVQETNQQNNLNTENQTSTPAVNIPQSNLSGSPNQTETSTTSNSPVQNSTVPVSQESTPNVNSSSITSSVIEPTPSTTSSSNSATTETSTTPASTETTSTTQTPQTATEPISSSTTTTEQTAPTTSGSTTTVTSEPTATSPATTSEPATANPTPETTSTPPVTNFFLGMLKTVSNFFLSFLSPTGMAVSDSNSVQINGEVSAEKTFTYSFKDGETVQLLPGSVKTNSKSLSDNTIKIAYQNNSVLISTDYSEKIIPTKNNSVSSKTDFNIQPLSEKEKEILNSGLGNYSIETTKSELYNGRYVVEYVLGDYNIKYSYDSNLNNETLNTQMENDKTKWLRDIANKISNA